MDPRSEVLLRQAELFQGDLLLAGLPADDLLGQLTHSLHLHALDEVFGPPPTQRRGVPIRETEPRH